MSTGPVDISLFEPTLKVFLVIYAVGIVACMLASMFLSNRHILHSIFLNATKRYNINIRKKKKVKKKPNYLDRNS